MNEAETRAEHSDPALRSAPMALSRASRRKQIPATGFNCPSVMAVSMIHRTPNHRALVVACALFGWMPIALAGDWRHDLLEASGIGTGREDIQAALAARQRPDAGFEKAYTALASESFREREHAQAEFLAGGSAALDWLKSRETAEDPEVRIRSHRIVQALTASPPAMRESLLLHAMRSLLDDDAATGGVFYEWFGTPAANCRNGYRQMRFEGPEGRLSEVADGRLILPGDRPGELDQRLVLDSKQWPGRERFPDHLTVRVLLAGGEGGGGTWHLAVTIGKVKTLFHPGFQGGGFRHEEVGTHKTITPHTGMGFTPEVDELIDMTLTLDRVAAARFSLKTRIRRRDAPPFENETLIDEALFGGLTSIGLERSGRNGGDARFEHFSITIRER